MKTSQNELMKYKAKLAAVEIRKDLCKNGIETLGLKLVQDLQKIPNWECMILNCFNHMKKYKDPNEFFKICSYEFDPYDNRNIIYVKKYYWGADPDGYVVLKLDLEIPLAKQVANKLAEIECKKNQKMMEQYNKDMETLKSLNIDVFDFETWLKRKKNIQKQIEIDNIEE